MEKDSRNKSKQIIYINEVYNYIYEIVQTIKYEYDARTVRCLDHIEKQLFNSSSKLIDFLLNIDEKVFAQIPAVGKKTITQVKDISSRLNQFYINYVINHPISSRTNKITSEDKHSKNRHSVYDDEIIDYTYNQLEVLKTTCSNHIATLLQQIENNIGDNKGAYIRYIIGLKSGDISNIYNIDKWIVAEFEVLVYQLKEIIFNNYPDSDFSRSFDLDKIDYKGINNNQQDIKYISYIYNIADNYSDIIYNDIVEFIKKLDESSLDIYMCLSSPYYINFFKRHIKEKYASEINNFRHLAITKFEETFPKHNIDIYTKIACYTVYNDKVIDIYKAIGHFPLFTALDIFINSLQQEEKFIINQHLKIYIKNRYLNSGQIAIKLSCSTAHIRHKSLKIIKHIQNAVASWSTHIDVLSYNEDISKIVSQVYNDEGALFTADFIKCIIALINEDVALYNDYIHCIRNVRKKHNLTSELY